MVSHRLVDDGVFTEDEAKGYGYTGNQVSLGASARLPFDVFGDGTVAYRYEDFDSESAQFTASGHRRHDNEVILVLALRRPLWQNTAIVAGYFGDFNDSNNASFDYDRHVVSLTMEARY